MGALHRGAKQAQSGSVLTRQIVKTYHGNRRRACDRQVGPIDPERAYSSRRTRLKGMIYRHRHRLCESDRSQCCRHRAGGRGRARGTLTPHERGVSGDQRGRGKAGYSGGSASVCQGRCGTEGAGDNQRGGVRARPPAGIGRHPGERPCITAGDCGGVAGAGNDDTAGGRWHVSNVGNLLAKLI